MVEKRARHTITINARAFSRLRSKGQFGESYSDVILRVLNGNGTDEGGQER